MCLKKLMIVGVDAAVGHGFCDEAYMVVAASSKGDWDRSSVFFDILVHGLQIRVVRVSCKNIL